MREVKVTWLDIYFLYEAETLEELRKAKPASQVTYGQLLVEEVDYITVVSTVDLEDNGEPLYRNAVTIPRGCIKGIEDYVSKG